MRPRSRPPNPRSCQTMCRQVVPGSPYLLGRARWRIGGGARPRTLSSPPPRLRIVVRRECSSEPKRGPVHDFQSCLTLRQMQDCPW
jgi:hypothetical protein